MRSWKDIIYILAFTIFSMQTFAMSGWKLALNKENGQYILQNSNYPKVPVEPEAPVKPKVLEVRNHHNFEIVVVDVGEVGTSCLIKTHRAYVFKKSEGTLIGSYPYRLIAVKNKYKKCSVRPINWEIYKTFIRIHDLNTGKKYKVQ